MRSYQQSTWSQVPLPKRSSSSRPLKSVFIAVLLIWPASILWGCLAASNHNARLRTQAFAASSFPGGHHPLR